MTSRDFVFWLQGFVENTEQETMTPKQFDMLKKHLHLVFKHEIDPSFGPEEHQKELDAIHHSPSHLVSGDGLIRC